MGMFSEHVWLWLLGGLILLAIQCVYPLCSLHHILFYIMIMLHSDAKYKAGSVYSFRTVLDLFMKSSGGRTVEIVLPSILYTRYNFRTDKGSQWIVIKHDGEHTGGFLCSSCFCLLQNKLARRFYPICTVTVRRSRDPETGWVCSCTS